MGEEEIKLNREQVSGWEQSRGVHGSASRVVVVSDWGWAAGGNGFKELSSTLFTYCLCPLVRSEQQDVDNVRFDVR